MFVMAGLVAIAVLVVANYPYLYKAYCTNTPTCRYYGPLSSPSSPSPGPSPTSYSPSYQAGYDSGTSGLARNTYDEEFDISDVAKSEQYACSTAFAGQHILNASLTKDDYVKGCLKAFSDHPPAKT